MGLGVENANVLYDQLRCARCGEVYGLAAEMPRGGKGHAGFRTSSTFYKTISRLHKQLLDRGVIKSPPTVPALVDALAKIREGGVPDLEVPVPGRESGRG